MTNIFIKTFGCAINQSDSEVLAGYLHNAQFDITDNIDEANLIIVNTCCVKKPTENNFFRYLDEIKKLRKPIVITGCIPQIMPEKVKEFSLLGTSQLTNIVDVVEETLNGSVVHLLVKEKNPRLNLPKIRRNDMIEIVPICSGCLGAPCTYCIVPQARGKLVSYDVTQIVKQILEALVENVKEVWLTAQDTGCYGKDVNDSLPNLLRTILDIHNKFLIRLGMINPNHLLEYMDELIDIYKSDKMFKFLHMPVQSGNNDILKKMKRKYSVEDFKKIVEKFRKEIPNITIATDIIVGFPTETKEQFLDSIKLIKAIKPDVLNISRFWPRPGTQAEKMKQIPGWETKNRSRYITDVFDWISFENNKKWKNWQGPILIDDHGKDDTFIGRNYAYKQVIVRSSSDIFGKILNVQVEQITKHDLRARIIG